MFVLVHEPVSVSDPVQGDIRADPRQVLALVLVPVPQVTEHPDQLSQGLQEPTGIDNLSGRILTSASIQ